MLGLAIKIASEAHVNQKRLNDTPYILHCIRVMLKMDTEEEQIVAILHDTIEDTNVTIEDLKNYGFSENILEALKLLTHNPNLGYHEYMEYIERISKNPITKKVKMADLEDNINVLELPNITDRKLDRLKKYHQAWNKLNET